MKKILSACLFLCFCATTYCANEEPKWNTTLIPDSLTRNANAVIRENSAVFEYTSLQSGKYTEVTVITILNEKGKQYANFTYSGDKYRTLSSFSGKILDAAGKVISKMKKSDVQSSEYSQYLATDNLNYFYNCEPPTYPCTIIYEYEIAFKNGIISFPPFVPQPASEISVQNASYTLQTPESTVVLIKNFNVSSPVKSTGTKNTVTYRWTASNLKAFENEPFMPSAYTFLPIAFARPEQFLYDGVSGEITDWNTMGKWISNLLKDRQTLTDAAKANVRALTANAATDREKVKILYDYLGKTTRYEAILLGIGGYQPMSAAEVCRVGFGDCKALSNYLHTMLQSIGIPAYYTVIKLDEEQKNVFEDYANFYQFNHVILQVPLKDETLWLECTNTEVPFGFVHNSIAGHQALVLTDEGGKLTRLPDYPDSLNIDKYISEIRVKEDGAATAQTTNDNKVKVYNNFRWFPKAKYSDQIDKLRKNIFLPNATVTKMNFSEDKSPLPNIKVNYEWETPLYGTKTGNRIFMPVNPLRKPGFNIKKGARHFDIEINEGNVDEDILTIIIPEGFTVEAMPSPVNYTSSFGTFTSTTSLEGNKITVRQKLLQKSGYWKAAQYPKLLTFIDKVNAAYRGKIIIKGK